MSILFALLVSCGMVNAQSESAPENHRLSIGAIQKFDLPLMPVLGYEYRGDALPIGISVSGGLRPHGNENPNVDAVAYLLQGRVSWHFGPFGAGDLFSGWSIFATGIIDRSTARRSTSRILFSRLSHHEVGAGLGVALGFLDPFEVRIEAGPVYQLLIRDEAYDSSGDRISLRNLPRGLAGFGGVYIDLPF